MNRNIVAFVILHYISVEDTINCVKSIQKIDMEVEYYIIIVDNASPNGSGDELMSMYKDEKNIRVVLSKENLGFARGNNLGYYYAKKEYGANFIIVVNNDVIFNESWKFQNILKIYNRTHADIIGPDVITEKGEHWSPFRLDSITSRRFIKKKIRNRKIEIFYFRMKKKYKVLRNVNIIENMMEKEKNKRLSNVEYKTERKGVVLHGSCVLFTPAYIESEKEAFNPKTFMYGEEDLLSQKARKKGYSILYTPDISILHIGESGTKSAHNENIEREIFMHTNMLKGYRLLLEDLWNE